MDKAIPFKSAGKMDRRLKRGKRLLDGVFVSGVAIGDQTPSSLFGDIDAA